MTTDKSSTSETWPSAVTSPHVSPRIAAQVTAVREEIATYAKMSGRQSTDIRLIAVTKSQTPSVIAPLQAAGIYDFGENRLDHLAAMAESPQKVARYHYIGRIQGRQLAKIIPYCSSLHSLCDKDHIERLGRACKLADKKMEIFFQVNVVDDDAKAGMLPDEISERLSAASLYEHLQVVGFMTMAPLDQNGDQADEKTIRHCFSSLRLLAEKHALPRLSMGMSHDFHYAILEGATDIRIGTRLFI